MNRLAQLLAAIAVAGGVQAAGPLAIKGVALGDPVEKLSLLGPCTLARGGICVGKTNYGPVRNADFIASYAAARVSGITVLFPQQYSAEVLAGLTARFGPSTAAPCKGGTRCHSWTVGDARLLLIETPGGVMLARAAPADGY